MSDRCLNLVEAEHHSRSAYVIFPGCALISAVMLRPRLSSSAAILASTTGCQEYPVVLLALLGK